MAAGIPAIRDGKAVIVADVALVAIRGGAEWRHLVVAHQRPVGGVVPGSSRERSGRGVAVHAIRCGEGRDGCGDGRVHGVIRVRPIGLMAGGIRAISSGNLQRVVATDMALGACQRGNGVFACQRKARCSVIKNGVCPVNSVVASGTLGDREARGNVIGNAAAQRLGAIPLR